MPTDPKIENVKLKVLSQAQYQFLVAKDPRGYYDDRTREQLYRLIEKLETDKKTCGRDENRLRKKFQGAEFGILLPAGQKTSGPLKFKPSLCVNGVHEGDITCGSTLIINAQGSVHGNITAEEVICKGQLAGDVTARGKLTVYSTGTLLGDVIAQQVQVAPGALFKGKCKLGGDRPGSYPEGELAYG